MDDKDDDFDQWLPGGLIDRSSSDVSSHEPCQQELAQRSLSKMEKQKENIWFVEELFLFFV